MILKSKRHIIVVISILSLLAILVSSLSCITIRINSPANNDSTSTTQMVSGSTRPHPPMRTGEINLGPKVEIASQSIDEAGGGMVISKPGDPLDGLTIGVPPDSYSSSRTFKVSSAPITMQTFGQDINPISPMIIVDNGGGYSDEIMYIRVPVKVPDGNFAMGFIYDEESKQLEGMPLVGMDADSITVATRHFSGFFVSMIQKTLLKRDIDSGFCPGIDDWQIPNSGSYIVPSGHCEGQSLSAMWYYCTQPDGKDFCLYGRYDNNGRQPATPQLWQDDSLGYRFCSVVQTEERFILGRNFWYNLSGKELKKVNNKWQWVDIPGISDEATLNLFVYSILANSKPQEVVIWSNAGGGHAMVVYKIVGNALYVADPNYPGSTDRKIIYYSDEGKFKPYSSGASRKDIDAGKGKSFEKMIYAGTNTVISWDKIAQRWAEFKNSTIGNDKFPQYELIVIDDSGTRIPLNDGFTTNQKMCAISSVQKTGNYAIACEIYRDGVQLPLDQDYKVELEPGNNLLGIYVSGDINNSWECVDFKYVTVNYNDTPDKYSLEPEVTRGVPEMWYSFKIVSSEKLEGKFFYWDFGDGSEITQTRDLGTTDHVFHKGGNFNITVIIRDKNDKELGRATGKAVITAMVEGTVRVSSPSPYSIREAYAVDSTGKKWSLYILPVSKAYLYPGHYTLHYSYVVDAPNQPPQTLNFQKEFNVPSVGTWDLEITPQK